MSPETTKSLRHDDDGGKVRRRGGENVDRDLDDDGGHSAIRTTTQHALGSLFQTFLT